jgi:glycine oxidase
VSVADPSPRVLRPIWFDELDRDEVASLDPGPQALLERPDVLVVGGGVVGVATALACVRAGLGEVLLVEQDRLASGASCGAAGMLTPEAHLGVDPDPFVELARLGYGGWRRLEADSPAGIGVVEVDWINLEPALFSVGDRPTPPGSRPLSAGDVGSLVPALATPVPGVVLRQARVNPVLAIARLARSAPPSLAVATGVRAHAATVAGGRVVSVHTTRGRISPGAVVFATGRPPALVGLDCALPSELVKGHMILTGAIDTPWPGIVAPLAVDIGGGRLLIGGSLDIGDDSPEVRPDMVEAMRALVASFVTPTAMPAVTHAWVCFRPAHPDRLPVIDRVPGLDNAWVASGHYRTGIVMAPGTAELLAQWVSSGQPPPLAEQFPATRFA